MNLNDDSPWGDVPARSNTDLTDTTQSTDPANSSSPQVPTSTKSPVSVISPRGKTSAKPRRIATTPTRLEAVDNALDPLGPLGDKSEPVDEPPELPRKEQQAPPGSRSSTAGSQASAGHNRKTSDDYDSPVKPRFPPPVQPPAQDTRRQLQPSLSLEQAAKPSFKITVGDPHKVGDITSSHTVYQVRTVTTSKAYRIPEFEVSRRYRDFLWLYNQLHNSNPGVVVPPPPEKQNLGRFDANFVESRRAALERMLNKTAAHPILQHDADLKMFLESEAFSVDVKQREKKDPDLLAEGKGMFGGLGLSVGSGSKFIEHDDWFLDRRVYLDTLESQLKALLKSTDTAVAQRKALAEACGDLSVSLSTLSQVELSPTLSGPLLSLSDLHVRIRDLYDRQAQQDVLTLGIVIDEYIRIIGSIKKAFEQRQKAWQNWHIAESDLQKRKTSLEKLMRSGRTQQDRLSQLQADVGDAERRSHQARLLFEDLGRSMRTELERFEGEKVEDFRMGVETFLESSVESQKELIEIWETYLMHLDMSDEHSTFAKPLAAESAVASTVAPPSTELGQGGPPEEPPAAAAATSPTAAEEED